MVPSSFVTMWPRITALLATAVGVAAAVALAIYLVASGRLLIAALWVLPFVVLIVASFSRGRGLSGFALTESIGGPEKTPDESARSYQLRLARWWALGALALPSSLLLLDFSIERSHLLGDIEALLAMPLPALGVACFVMCLVSIARGLRART